MWSLKNLNANESVGADQKCWKAEPQNLRMCVISKTVFGMTSFNVAMNFDFNCCATTGIAKRAIFGAGPAPIALTHNRQFKSIPHDDLAALDRGAVFVMIS